MFSFSFREHLRTREAFKGAATWENRIFAYAKTKTQINFATRIVQSTS